MARRGRGTPATAAITALVRPPLRVLSGGIAALFYLVPLFFSYVREWAMSRGQVGALARACRSGGVATSSGQGCVNTTRGASMGASLGVVAASVRGRRGRGGHAPVAPSRFATQRGGAATRPTDALAQGPRRSPRGCRHLQPRWRCLTDCGGPSWGTTGAPAASSTVACAGTIVRPGVQGLHKTLSRWPHTLWSQVPC